MRPFSLKRGCSYILALQTETQFWRNITAFQSNREAVFPCGVVGNKGNAAFWADKAQTVVFQRGENVVDNRQFVRKQRYRHICEIQTLGNKLVILFHARSFGLQEESYCQAYSPFLDILGSVLGTLQAVQSGLTAD